MHNQSKTPNTEAYDWKPELLTRIDPAPNYKNSPLAKIKGKKYVNLKMGEETAFHYRSAVMKKMYHKEKKVLGRIFAHLKQIELREFIKTVRKNEGTLKEEEKTEDQKVTDLVRNMESSRIDLDVDPDFGLPYGMGYDQIIKEKADVFVNNKFYNNIMMDQLVQKLGYLDYRDALAINKYILEAKKHGDFRQ